MKITVIGDLILDKTIYTKKKDNKEGVFYCGNEDFQHYQLGGAGLVAANLATMGHDVTLLTSSNIKMFSFCHNDDWFKWINVEPKENSHACVKNRIVDLDSNNVIVRYDWDDITVPGKFKSKYWKNADVIVIADYNKGTITEELVNELPKNILYVDTKPCHMDWYKGAFFLKCNKNEYQEYSKGKEINDVAKALDVNYLCVTLGARGAVCSEYGENYFHVCKESKGYASNVCGAGDLFLSIVVDTYGHIFDMEGAIKRANDICTERVKENKRCEAEAKDGLLEGATVITGCFDMLHPGHLKALEHAYKTCHKVIVLLNSDNYVEKTKGRKPIYSWSERAEMLKATKYVDSVKYVNDDEDVLLWLKTIKPWCRVLGSDYKGKKIVGEKYSGIIEYVDRDDFSTTNIIEGIKQSS